MPQRGDTITTSHPCQEKSAKEGEFRQLFLNQLKNHKIRLLPPYGPHTPYPTSANYNARAPLEGFIAACEARLSPGPKACRQDRHFFGFKARPRCVIGRRHSSIQRAGPKQSLSLDCSPEVGVKSRVPRSMRLLGCGRNDGCASAQDERLPCQWGMSA